MLVCYSALYCICLLFTRISNIQSLWWEFGPDSKRAFVWCIFLREIDTRAFIDSISLLPSIFVVNS